MCRGRRRREGAKAYVPGRSSRRYATVGVRAALHTSAWGREPLRTDMLKVDDAGIVHPYRRRLGSGGRRVVACLDLRTPIQLHG